jgi:hypothetical protein
MNEGVHDMDVGMKRRGLILFVCVKTLAWHGVRTKDTHHSISGTLEM